MKRNASDTFFFTSPLIPQTYLVVFILYDFIFVVSSISSPFNLFFLVFLFRLDSSFVVRSSARQCNDAAEKVQRFCAQLMCIAPSSLLLDGERFK